MFVLRKTQLDRFAAHQRKNAENRILSKLSEEYELDPAEIDAHALVRQGTENALGYGIEDEGDVYDFVVVCIEFGLDVDTDPEYPWAREILVDSEKSGRQKVLELLAILDEVNTHSIDES